MPGLNRLNRQQVKEKIKQYPQRYVNNWDHWLRVKIKAPNNIPTVFGEYAYPVSSGIAFSFSAFG